MEKTKCTYCNLKLEDGSCDIEVPGCYDIDFESHDCSSCKLFEKKPELFYKTASFRKIKGEKHGSKA